MEELAVSPTSHDYNPILRLCANLINLDIRYRFNNPDEYKKLETVINGLGKLQKLSVVPYVSIDIPQFLPELDITIFSDRVLNNMSIDVQTLKINCVGTSWDPDNKNVPEINNLPPSIGKIIIKGYAHDVRTLREKITKIPFGCEIVEDIEKYPDYECD